MLIRFPGTNRSFQENATSLAPPLPAPLQQLRGYWEALRQGGLPPERSCIDPRGIESALGGAFIVERVATGIARFRIAGAQFSDLIGCDPRGMPLSILFEPQGRKALSDPLEQVFLDPAILELRLEAERGIGKPALSAHMLILPLRNDWGKTELGLGAIALTGDIGRKQRRFFIASASATPLVARPTAPLAEPATDIPVSAAPAASRTYLRLVHSAE